MPKHVAGDMVWRSIDNKLFIVKEVIHNKIYVLMDPLNLCPQPQIQYVTVPTIDGQEWYDDKPFSSSVPKMPIVGQHVWRKGTGAHFRVEKIRDNFKDNAFDPEGPCNKCHNGKCEQCNWGYRNHDDVMKEYKEMWQPYNRYDITVLSLDGKTQFKMNTVVFNNDYTMIPPNISELTKNILGYTYDFERKKQYEQICKTYENAEIEDIDLTKSYGGYNEAVAEAIKDEAKDSYQKWKDSLHVINVPKFDLNYFVRKRAYYIKKHQTLPLEADALLMSASEDELEFLRIEGGKNMDFQASELVKIPIKEYLNGTWTIKRLGGDDE